MGLNFWHKEEPAQQELRTEPVLSEGEPSEKPKEAPAAMAPASAIPELAEAAQDKRAPVPEPVEEEDPQPKPVRKVPARRPRPKALPREELPDEDDPAHLVRVKARRRLIGAVILLVFVVALIPWILGHETPEQENRVVVTINNAAPKTSGPAVIPTGLPAPEPKKAVKAPQPAKPAAPAAPAKPAAAPARVASAEPARSALTSSHETVVEAPAAAASEDARREAEMKKAAEVKKAQEARKAAELKKQQDAKKAQEVKDAGKKAGRYAVQAGAFGAQKTAQAKAADIRRAGIAASVEPLKTAKGTLWRVRTGPFATAEAAAAARARLQRMGFVPSGVIQGE